MATIRKKGDYQWHVQVRRKGFPTQTKTFTAKVDAERWGKETEIAIERGLFFDRSKAERSTLTELIERYRVDILPSKRGKHFASALRQLDTVLGQYSLASITSEMIAKHRDARLKIVSQSTVKKEINLLSSLIDLAGKEWGIPIAINPCLMVKRPTEPKGRDRRLLNGEETLLLSACSQSSPELKAIAQVALETGARLGELLKLERSHINFLENTAKLFDTKNGDDRIIPLSLAAISALKSIAAHPNGKVFGNWSASDSFNKTWMRATIRARNKYEKTCQETRQKADASMLIDLKFHDLRHEAISRLFERGDLSMMEIAMMSGHKTLAMLKRYTHLRASDIAKKLG
jgi:integrase